MSVRMVRACPAGRIVRRLVLVAALGAAICAPAGRAASPQPYTVRLGPTGDPALQAALAGISQLVALRQAGGHQGAPVAPFALLLRARQDRGRFLAALHSFGYYQGKVTIRIDGRTLESPGLLTRLEAAPAKPPVPVTVTFAPGPRFHIGRVRLTGTMPEGARSALGLKPGAPARAGAVLAARDRLLAALRKDGYALAKVTLEPAVLHPDTHLMDVVYAVDSGRVISIGPISFAGSKGVNPAFLRRRMTLHEGQRFSPAALASARASLLDLPIFSYVQAVPAASLDQQGRLPVTFRLAERPRHAVDLGADYSTDLGVGLTAGWHDRNLFGNAEQLDLTGAFQAGGNAVLQPGYKTAATYREPDWHARGQTLVLQLGALHQSLIPYTQTAVTEAARLERPIAPHWTLSYGVAGEQETIIQEGVSRVYYLLRLPVRLSYDNTNSKLNPTRGLRGALTLTPTQSLLGHGGFVIAELSGASYLDLEGSGRGVLALRGLAGEVLGASSPFSLPPDQRFYAGGSTTVRGYRFQSLGPQFADGTPSGGTEIAAGTIEFRQRVLKNWGFSVFTDAGEVAAAGTPAPVEYGVGVGAGLQYYTSIGPIRAEFAVPAIRRPNSGAFQIYIGIGQAF
ncbi:MAG: BamA/TamA family outer membrane protein [Rhodospirillales bacterium]|nr:BamA/TamA family outer membrane protein [Rhodospirillales bacterium]